MTLVSVIVAAYNAEETLARCLESVAAQRGVETQIIAIDDASTDGTQAVLESLRARFSQLEIVRRPKNAGPSAARNAGLEAARGEWIAIVDADDEIEPERLAAMVAAAQGESADLCFDNMFKIVAGREEGVLIDPPTARRLRESWTVGFFARENRPYESRILLGFLKPVFRASFLRAHKIRYAESVSRGEDYLFVLECLAQGARVCYLDRPLYRYAVAKKSLSGAFDAKAHENFIRAERAFLDLYASRLPPADAQAVRAHLRSVARAGVTNGLFAALRRKDWGAFLFLLLSSRADAPLHLMRIGCAAWRKLRGNVNRGR